MNPGKAPSGQLPLSLDLLTADAVLMVSAGMSTTAYTSQVGCWHLLQDQAIAGRLIEELNQAVPELSSGRKPPALDQLEQLPFLVSNRHTFVEYSQWIILIITIESSYQRVITPLIWRTGPHGTRCTYRRNDCGRHVRSSWSKSKYFLHVIYLS